MGQLAVPLMIAQTVVSAVGAYQGAKAQKQELKYNAAIARNNAIYERQLEERNLALAEDALKRGETEEYRQRLRTKAIAGQQQSAFASSNVQVDYGSPIDLIGDVFQLGELDALTIRNNAQREANQYENSAWANRVGASNYDAQAGLLTSQASNISPGFAAFTTLLNGASTTAGSYNKLYPKSPETIFWNQGGTTTIG